jgi:hypothetical protein
LPERVRELILSAAGKHRRYLDVRELKYAKHPPRTHDRRNSEEHWEWLQKVFGPRIASEMKEDARARGIETIAPLFFKLDDFYGPKVVGAISGQIEREIARKAGVSRRTLRLWCREHRKGKFYDSDLELKNSEPRPGADLLPELSSDAQGE